MKMFKKIAALAMSAVMAVGMMAPAWAARGGNSTPVGSTSITIKETEPGTKYHVYKLFEVWPANDEGTEFAYGLGSTRSNISGENGMYYSPWIDFILDENLGGKYLDVAEGTELHGTTGTIKGFWINGSPVGWEYRIAWKAEMLNDENMVREFIQAALKFAREHDDVLYDTATVPEGENEVTIPIAGNSLMGYYLVDTSMGSLCMIGTQFAIRQGVTIEEKNSIPKLAVDIWEEYDGDVDCCSKSVELSDGNHATLGFGDPGYITATITVGSKGAQNYQFLLGEFDGISGKWVNGLNPLKNHLLYITQDGERLTEGTDYIIAYSDPSYYGSDGSDWGTGRVIFNDASLKKNAEIVIAFDAVSLGRGLGTATGDGGDIKDPAMQMTGTLFYNYYNEGYETWESIVEGNNKFKAGQAGWQNPVLVADGDAKKLTDEDYAVRNGVQFIKVKATGDLLDGAKFTLYYDEACTQPVRFVPGMLYSYSNGYFAAPGYWRVPDEGLFVSTSEDISVKDRDLFNSEVTQDFQEVFAPDDSRIDDEKITADYGTEEWGRQHADQLTTTVLTGTDGVFNLSGLACGTYYLKETEAPEGYNKLGEKETVMLVVNDGDNYWLADGSFNGGFFKEEIPPETDWDDSTYEWHVTSESKQKNWIKQDESGYTGYYVINLTGAELPHTGGIGTTIFYVVGGALVVGAGILLVAKKRMNSDSDSEK